MNVRLAAGINWSFSSCDLQDFQAISIPSRKSSQGNIASHFLIVLIFGTSFSDMFFFFHSYLSTPTNFLVQRKWVEGHSDIRHNYIIHCL